MDDLIVILLMLAFTIIGGIAQSKKKKAKAPANSLGSSDEVPGKSDFWETLLGEDVAQVKKEEEIPAFSFENNPQEKEVVSEPVFEEGASSTKNEKMDKILSKEDKDLTNNESQESIFDGFSLKKGIVYSEILNRKYF